MVGFFRRASRVDHIQMYIAIIILSIIFSHYPARGGMGQTQDDGAKTIDTKNSTIWGPGLKPHEVVLPARYFFVHLKGPGGQKANITESIREALKVRIDCSGNRQIWTQVLDRKDGSFIVRYKLYQSCPKGFRIIVTFHKKHVGKSPYNYNVPVHPDNCYCPRFESWTWLKKVKCPKSYSQIESDLAPFESVDFDNVLERAVEHFYNPGANSFCHYVVKYNEIHRKCYGQHVGFHIFPDSFLLSMARKMYLPDMEFIINLGDWPLVDVSRIRPPIPIFSWCKSNVTADILLPTYELTEASLEAMGRNHFRIFLRVSLDMMTVQSNIDKPWSSKIPKVFWRGRDSRQERLDLVSIGRKHPELINASLTNFFFFRDKEHIYGPKESHVSFFKFFDYKYQLNIDGTVSAYRFPFLLAGDSVVFKTESPYIEHFYRDLKAWRHYIPVEGNLSDLIKKIKWALDRDDEAKNIGEEGMKYARENLMPLDVFCYHVTLFKEWSKRLKNTVVVRKDMELVTQKESDKQTCQCSPRRRNYESDDAADDKDEL